MIRKLATLLAALLLAALPIATTAATATAATPKTSVTDVEDEVMCVACGVPLDIAESPQAAQERSYIRQLVAQGKTKQEIKDELVAQYGDRVLALPKDKGFGAAAYLVPIAIVVIALAAGLYFVPKWRKKRGGAGDDLDQGPALTDADARRLEEDLARYEV
ncbi:MAG TPA: cytochrome c-type biogenesis protein [Baekduia sp.]|uniref:cytochrome c-type biogenesis protein n=1 Tax=Baekduia sp. TaxID=2600305 RepID=UPI002D76668A|nr:cytochrome c-type biogenesis protein [Baekduia sp.]HET6505605.1 cytochrome c-type biogenesis protein [Baekduia sp.]